jgi:short-subunit dehydrogenase
MYSTALVTGASSGLGEVFADELARLGCGLVLVARRADALTRLAATLRERYAVPVEVLAADLADPAGLSEVELRLLADPYIDLLVNSAGTLGRIGALPLVGSDVADGVITLNVSAPVRLTRAAVRSMLPRRHGGVINVSSVNGFWPTPGGAVYSASKAFLVSFSQSVHGEVSWHGVHVTALCPGSVRSGLHETAGHRGGRVGRPLDPRRVVQDGLAAVAAGRPLVVPGAEYRVKAALARLVPGLARGYFYRRWGRPAGRALATLAGPGELTSDGRVGPAPG